MGAKASHTELPKLVINTYETKEVYESRKNQGLLNDGELHLIGGDDDDVEALSNAEIETLLNNFTE